MIDATEPAAPPRHAWRLPLGLTPGAVLSLVWVVVMLIIAIGAPLLALYDYDQIDLRGRLQPPVWLPGGDWRHPLGSDDLGRDVYSRLLFSIRTSVFVAIVGTVIGALIGTTLGFLAAHFGRMVDEAVVLAIDFQAALPFMILALAVVAFFGNSIYLFVAVIGIYGWERYARITRGMTLAALGQGYAVALKVLGAGPVRLYLRHILPNIAGALTVCLTLTFPHVILLETSLSFLGLGVQPPQTSLGNMVGFGRDYLLTAWWIAICPAATIFLTTLAISIFGDWLADRLDPTLRN
ncbi:MAG: ABC transporter permease [Alphaproteobacteria bacterium]|nr:ABC transporter permease [Alphaproteobacteria bacterium]